jgi:hypothetical protein
LLRGSRNYIYIYIYVTIALATNIKCTRSNQHDTKHAQLRKKIGDIGACAVWCGVVCRVPYAVCGGRYARYVYVPVGHGWAEDSYSQPETCEYGTRLSGRPLVYLEAVSVLVLASGLALGLSMGSDKVQPRTRR